MSRVIPPHLTKGSTRPPLVEGKLRLYSMEYCPFAQRVRLVLLAKKIPHDIVNINLIEKPEWYFDINPKGLVPAIDTGSEVITESLNISQWLEEKFTNILLYPSDLIIKQRDKTLISKIDDIATAFSISLLPYENINPKTISNSLKPYLKVYEKELDLRKSLFFRGRTPGMLDYMLYPWAERFEALNVPFSRINIFENSQFPLLNKWNTAMNVHPVCTKTRNSSEILWKVIENKVLPKKNLVSYADDTAVLCCGENWKEVNIILSDCLNKLDIWLRNNQLSLNIDKSTFITCGSYVDGLVPAIDTGSEIVLESLDISNWLDEKYPENLLYPKDSSAKQHDKEIIAKISNVTTPFYKGLMKKDNLTASETAKELAPQLEIFEKELTLRGSTFFGGDKPGMIDYMLWPFAERSKCLQFAYGSTIIEKNKFSLLTQWKKAMLEDSACSQTYNGPEKYWKLFENRVKGLPVDYDSVIL